jgi:hypothetical protein
MERSAYAKNVPSDGGAVCSVYQVLADLDGTHGTKHHPGAGAILAKLRESCLHGVLLYGSEWFDL